MSSCYEWIDPFAEVERAKRQANSAYDEGRRSVLRPLEEGLRRNLAQQLEVATAQLGREVALHMAREAGAKWSYEFFQDRVLPDVAEAFRRGCGAVIGKVMQPSASRVRFDMQRRIDADATSMTIKYETVRPIAFAYAVHV